VNAGALFANNVSTGGTASSTGTGKVTVASGATLGGGTTTPTTGFYDICSTVRGQRWHPLRRATVPACSW